MNLDNLKIKFEEFSKKKETELKDKLKEKGHFESGELYNSIKVNVIYLNDKINIKFSAKEYLKFLDKGEFLKVFINTLKKDAEKIVSKEFKKDVIKELKKK